MEWTTRQTSGMRHNFSAQHRKPKLKVALKQTNNLGLKTLRHKGSGEQIEIFRPAKVSEMAQKSPNCHWVESVYSTEGGLHGK